MELKKDDSESILERAEYWFARLRAGNSSTADQREFEIWQAADPAHAKAYAQTRQLWEELSGLSNDREVAGWRREALAVSPGRRTRTTQPGIARWGWAIAASLLIASSVVGYRMLQRQAEPAVTSHYATNRGEVRQIVLADGSHLTMNADTAIDVTMDRYARSVYLSQGEVVVEVAHDAQRSFTVYASGNTIHDIGTRFDVNLAEAHTDITVLDGIVNVVREGNSATLTHGDRLAAGNGVWRQSKIDPAVATGWVQGKLVFRDTPLDEAVAQANRYGADKLVIADPSLKNMTISGDFRIGQTASLVRALQSAFPINARFDKASGETRLSRR